MAAARELVIGDDPAAWRALGFAVGDDGWFGVGGLRVCVAGGGGGLVELLIEGIEEERPDGLPIVAAGPSSGLAARPSSDPVARPDRTVSSGTDAPDSSAGARSSSGPAARRDRSISSDSDAPDSSAAARSSSGPAARRDRLISSDSDAPDSSAGGPRDLPSSTHPNGATAVDHVVVFTDDRDRTTAALAAAGGDVRRRGGPPELPAPMAFVRFGELVVEVAQAGGAVRFWGVTIVVPDVDALAGPLLGAARPAVQRGRRIATVKPAAGLSLAVALITPR